MSGDKVEITDAEIVCKGDERRSSLLGLAENRSQFLAALGQENAVLMVLRLGPEE